MAEALNKRSAQFGPSIVESEEESIAVREAKASVCCDQQVHCTGRLVGQGFSPSRFNVVLSDLARSNTLESLPDDVQKR